MNQETDFLSLEDLNTFIEGKSNSSFTLEEGSYDNARVVGWTLVKAEFDGKERKLVRLLWQIKVDDKTTHTLRGAGWSLSASENSTFRKDLTKWFDKTDWGAICDILVKRGIIVKNAEGNGARFDISKFIGLYGKLLIQEKTSKKGSKYSVIAAVSPAKKKEAFDFGEVPEFLVKGDEVLQYGLADGVKIRTKNAEDTGVASAMPPNKDAFSHQMNEMPEDDEEETKLPWET